MSVEKFKKCSKQATNKADIETAISQFEKQLLKSLSCVTVRGKRGGGIPILFFSDTEKDIVLLMEHRTNYVNNYNTYLFACCNGTAAIALRVFDALRTICSQIPLQCPEVIKTTKLRKHVAIMFQLVNLKDNILDLLARFMGHDIRIYREYCSLP